MMKRLVMLFLLGGLLVANSAWAITFTFSDKDFLEGASWGTLEIVAIDSDTLQVTYTASSASIIPEGSAVAGFAFLFNSGTIGENGVRNPAADAFSYDLDLVDWYKLDNVNNLPTPANLDEFSSLSGDKNPFSDGATTDSSGNNVNQSNGAILPSQTDTFYIDLSDLTSIDLLTVDLTEFVELTGVRLQSLPDEINDGSLFLIGRLDDGTAGPAAVVPEPGTVILLGVGVLGLNLSSRKKTFH